MSARMYKLYKVLITEGRDPDQAYADVVKGYIPTELQKQRFKALVEEGK